MRKLPFVTGAALAMALAATASAASPAPSTTPSPATPQRWTTTLHQGAVSGRATLWLSSTRRSGRMTVKSTGLPKGSKADLLLVQDATGHVTALSTDVVQLTSASGTVSATWTLHAATTAKIEAALKANDRLEVSVKDGTSTASGFFQLAKA